MLSYYPSIFTQAGLSYCKYSTIYDSIMCYNVSVAFQKCEPSAWLSKALQQRCEFKQSGIQRQPQIGHQDSNSLKQFEVLNSGFLMVKSSPCHDHEDGQLLFSHVLRPVTWRGRNIRCHKPREPIQIGQNSCSVSHKKLESTGYDSVQTTYQCEKENSVIQ